MHTLLEKAAARIAAGTAPLENAAEAVELARLPRSENPDIFACAALARARFAGPVFTCAIINAGAARKTAPSAPSRLFIIQTLPYTVSWARTCS